MKKNKRILKIAVKKLKNNKNGQYTMESEILHSSLGELARAMGIIFHNPLVRKHGDTDLNF